MKKRILPLLLAASFLLSGCTSMLERSDVSATAHVDYSVVTEDTSILRVETYQDLVNSVLYFINERAREGTIRLYNYTGDVETDLANACDEVMHKDPLGAYSVRNITYDSTRILTYYEVDLSLSYSRTADEVASIREIIGISALRDELASMVDQQSDRLTLLASYFSGNEDLIFQLLSLARYSRPDLYLDPGGSFSYDISIYPETGSRRIIEIKVDNWGAGRYTTSKELDAYAQQLKEAATLLLEANPPAGTAYTAEELAVILRAAAGGYDYHGTQLALGTLSGAAAGEMGYMLALEYLCQQSGVEVTPVFSPPNTWLIVATEDGYRHLLPRDLFPVTPEEVQDPEAPVEPYQLPLYTDDELEALGYSWVRGLYPACEASEEPPAAEESAAPEEPAESAEPAQ